MQNLNVGSMSRRIFIGMTATCLLVACGVDQVAGIQGSGAPVASGVTTTGPISGFGSIFVDGVEYVTSGAQIRIDEQPATESQLRVGQIVTIKGTVNASGASAASDVSFSSDVRGPVTHVDLASSAFTVLGQTVLVTDATLFDESFQPADLTGLSAGALVQVSGFPNSTGALVASRVDPASAADLQVKGTVESLDTVAHTFRISALTVDYTTATVTGTLSNASKVVVRGTTPGSADTLVATRVTVIAPLGAAANDSGRVEGLVTSFVSTADFAVNGQRVITDGSTEFVLNGMTLGLDVAVKVRGTFNANGALVASRVEVKARSASLLRGVVDSVASAGNTLTILGVPITTSGDTAFEDRSSQHVRLFRLADVRAGDYVEVRGTASASGNGLVASLVQRDNPEARSYVQGVARTVFDPNFSVFGIMVMADAQTRFIGLGGQSTARAQFFSEAPDEIVKVRGTVIGGILVADQAQILN